MIILGWKYRLLYFYFLFGYVKATWPSSRSSTIQLLGLFADTLNASKSTDSSVQSRAMFKSAVLLSQMYNITIDGQLIGWQSAQTGGDVIEALSSTCEALSISNIIGIVGPELSREAHLIAPLAKKVGIPVISHSATDPDLSDRASYPNFYRTVPSDNTAAQAIVKLFVRFNWTSCIIIYQNDVFGSGGAKALENAFIQNNFTIQDLIIFDTITLNIRGNLTNRLMNSASRIVVAWVDSTYIFKILQTALIADVLGPKFTWILTANVSLNSFDKTFDDKLLGLFSIIPVTGSAVDAQINSTLLNAAYSIWNTSEPETFPGPSEVDFYALFAFDATWTLIQSLEKLCPAISVNSSSCLSFIQSPFCFNHSFVNSDVLLNITTATDFLGVSGLVKFDPTSTDRMAGSYYYILNAQPASNRSKFVPVLQYSRFGDWQIYRDRNIIIWPGNTLTPSTDRAVLKGVTLRIGVIESNPFTMVRYTIDAFGTNSTEYTGYVPDLIDLLKQKMQFNPIILLAPSNLTYDAVVNLVASGYYDIVIADVTVTAKRREVVGFSNAIFDNSLNILIRATPDVNINLLSFLKPFSLNLWLLVLAACVYAGILLCLLERHNNETLEGRSILSQLFMSVWYSFGNMVGYGVDFDVNTAAGRLLTAGLYMLSLILVASYTANLASDLTISKSKGVISGIDDIKSGKIPYSRIGIRVGTASEDFYLREISGGSRNYYPLKSRKELYDSLLGGIIDVSFQDSGVAEYVTNNVYCNLTLVGDDFDKGVFGVVTPKQWLYAKDLDVNILSLRESGDLDTLKQKHFQKRNCPDATTTATAMEIQTMSGLFLIFAVVSALSVLLFVWSKRFILKNSLLIILNRQ